NTVTNASFDELETLIFMDKPATLRQLASVFKGINEETLQQSSHPQLNAHLLIAEDNEFTRFLLTTHLDKLHCSYKTVSNGNEVINICQSETFDLILMDVHMPQANGIEALQWIRNHSG